MVCACLLLIQATSSFLQNLLSPDPRATPSPLIQRVGGTLDLSPTTAGVSCSATPVVRHTKLGGGGLKPLPKSCPGGIFEGS